jgi:hypothetical protein
MEFLGRSWNFFHRPLPGELQVGNHRFLLFLQECNEHVRVAVQVSASLGETLVWTSSEVFW